MRFPAPRGSCTRREPAQGGPEARCEVIDSRRALVNQKLYFADLALTQTEAVEGLPARQALLQAAVFHLHTAYRAYLGEIAATQGRDIDAPHARVAVRLLADLGVLSPELEELAALEQQGGWPARLLEAFSDASAIVPAATPVRPAGELRLTDVTRSADATDCRGWLEAFRALTEAHRERFQEW